MFPYTKHNIFFYETCVMGKFYAGIYVAGCSVLYSIPINIESRSSYRTVNTVDLAVHYEDKLINALDKYKRLQL